MKSQNRKTNVQNVTPTGQLVATLKQTGTDLSTLQVDQRVADKVLAPSFLEVLASTAQSAKSWKETIFPNKSSSVEKEIPVSIVETAKTAVTSAANPTIVQTPSTSLITEASNVASFAAIVHDTKSASQQRGTEAKAWLKDIKENNPTSHRDTVEQRNAQQQKPASLEIC